MTCNCFFFLFSSKKPELGKALLTNSQPDDTPDTDTNLWKLKCDIRQMLQQMLADNALYRTNNTYELHRSYDPLNGYRIFLTHNHNSFCGKSPHDFEDAVTNLFSDSNLRHIDKSTAITINITSTSL